MDSHPILLINLENLKFDSDNPRLPSRIRGSQSAILEWMITNEKIVELMVAIGERGYFPGEPVLVVKVPGKDDKYFVVEGNRRLAAVKLLNNPSLAMVKPKSVESASESAKHRPNEIPALVFPSRNDIVGYLGYRHITGIETWDSLAKARYLKQLFDWTEADNPSGKFRELARSIGSRADYVERLLTGLAVYEKIEDEVFFGINGLSEESIDFSVLTTALSYSSLAKYLGVSESKHPDLNISKERLKELTTWLFEKNPQGKTKLGESRNLKYLAAVVETPKALVAFKRGEPLEQAAMLTEVPSLAFQNAILEAKNRLRFAQNYFYEVNTPTEADIEILSDIKRIASDLENTIRGRLAEQESVA